MNVPIVYLCAFSIFLSLTLLFYNKGYKGANRFLSGYLFCSSLFLLTQYFFIYSKSALITTIFVTGFPALSHLFGPFAYFYVRSIFRDNVRLSKNDYWHFLLFFIILIGVIPFFFSSWEYKLFISQKIVERSYMGSIYNINFLVPKIINQLLRPLSALFYLVLVSRIYIRNRNVFNSFSHAKVIKIWLGIFYLLFSLTFVFSIIVHLVYHLDINFFYTNSAFYYVIISIAFFYLILNFLLVMFPQILYGLPIPKLVLNHSIIKSDTKPMENSTEIAIPIIENKTTPVADLFSNEYELEIETLINEWIAEKKYLEANATLISISTFTAIPVHHLSYYFNAVLKVKYANWRNTLRINFAKKQIDSGFSKTITLEALSLESGFATQSTFIKSFKNDLGCTPSEYLKTKSY
jgi:AraC-like DNA-binding protein